MLSEVKSHQIFSGNFALYVLDLSQLDNVSEEERSSELYRWARIFKATTWEELQILTNDSEELQEGISYMYELTSEEQIRWHCFARELFEMDQQVARKTQEKYRKDAEMAKQEAEIAKQEAELAKQEAKAAKHEAESAKQKLEKIRQDVRISKKNSYHSALSTINELNYQLIRDNRMDDLMRSAEDEAFQQQLLSEYGFISPD